MSDHRDDPVNARTRVQQPELLGSLLAGKTLGCWCAPRRCHGDVLARLGGRASTR